MSAIFYIFGTTCVGKDYLIEHAVAAHPDLFGAVQVGKRMRELHPPEYFEGSGAPEKCEPEAFAIFKEQLDAALAAKKKWILVSGQPRRPSQVETILGYAPGTILWLHASQQVVECRMAERFRHDPRSLALALQRTTSDRILLFDTLFFLEKRVTPIIPFDTSEYTVEEIIHNILVAAPHACKISEDQHGLYNK